MRLSTLQACVLVILGVTSLSEPVAADDDLTRDLAARRFPGGAVLKTDSEQQRLLKRAEQCVAEGRLDLAAVLWQKVLDDSADTLFSRDGRVYVSLAEQVELAIVKLPKLALDAYRTSADGEARALLAAAGPDGEENALARIERRFFLSSIGDDAAYKLACLALDRHDFVTASRLLTKILERHPDPSILKGEILLRLAVAHSRMGDRRAAEQALAQLASVAGARPSTEVVELVVADFKSGATAALDSTTYAGKDLRMAFGDSSRRGHMASLPTDATSRPLTELWIHDFLQAQSQSAERSRADTGIGLLPASREEIVSRWRTGGWRPAGKLLFDDGRVYFKTANRLVCYSTAPGNQPLWQSAEHEYELDGISQQIIAAALSMGSHLPQQAQGKPKTLQEIQVFGDRVHQSVTIADGVVYAVEGRRVIADQPPQPPAVTAFRQVGTQRRTRGNWLTAYQAGSGKILWTRTAIDEQPDDLSSSEGLRPPLADLRPPMADVGFLAAPVACGQLLLTPVTDGGTIWLLGLKRATGKKIWKSYLCDEPQGGAVPWAEVVLATEGGEAYVTCGCGVVFAVDAAHGNIHWAVRYERDNQPGSSIRQAYGISSGATLLSGWDDDLVIPHGRALFIMSSDSEKLVALDRHSGEVLWESPRTSPGGGVASYCLGLNGSGLFVAGENVVRRHDIGSGRVTWEKNLGDSFGRGCLTGDALYLPVKDLVLKLDPETGRQLALAKAMLTIDEPVGNLFSDGEKLWVVGAARVYAMTALEERLTMLAKQIETGDGEAQLTRMRLYARQNRIDLALADWRGAYSLLRQASGGQQSSEDPAMRLFDAMLELKLSQSHPLIVLSLLTDLAGDSRSFPTLGAGALARRSDVVASAIRTIAQQRPAGAAKQILNAAPLLAEEHLITAASYALDAVAVKEDLPVIIAALQGSIAPAQLVAIRAATQLASEEARAALAPLLRSRDDRVRLAVARALANLGERKGVLETFAVLLESESPRVRARSHQCLQALTGQRFAFIADAKPEDRAAAVNAWKQWIETGGRLAPLRLPLAEQAIPLGRTLYVSQGQGTITELDSDRKPRWHIRLPGPAWGCQGLPNGHRLVAIYSHSMVVEYDDTGMEVWRKDRLPGPPYSVQRLESGNTLVACADAHQIVEIFPDGTTASITVPGRPLAAQRLENGNTLVALQQAGRVVEVDRTGKIVWEIRTPTPPGHVVRLDNGNTLVCLTHGRQVVEFDSTGKHVIWRSQAPLTNPYAAQRLANGNTLVADHMGLHEIDASGKNVVHTMRQSQVTGLSSF